MRGDVLPNTLSPAAAQTTLIGEASGVLDTYSAQAMGAVPTFRLNNTGTPAPHTLLPRRMFAFWDSTPIPAIAAACISLMKNENPTWRMELLDADSAGIEQPPEGPQTLEPQHVSDWTRLAVIARYGGVYMDATSIVLQQNEEIFDPTFNGLQGFTLGQSAAFSDPAVGALPAHEQMENFAFAAPPGNTLVNAWLAEYKRAIEMGLDNYKSSVNASVVGDVLISQLPYLTAYAAFRVARSQNPHASLRLMQATDCAINDAGLYRCGPYNYLENPVDTILGGLNETGAGSQAALDGVFAANATELSETPMIKLRGGERILLEQQPDLWANHHSYLGNRLVDALPQQVDVALVPKEEGTNWGVITVSVLAPIGFLILLALVALYLQRARQAEPVIKEVGKEGLLAKEGDKSKGSGAAKCC